MVRLPWAGMRSSLRQAVLAESRPLAVRLPALLAVGLLVAVPEGCEAGVCLSVGDQPTEDDGFGVAAASKPVREEDDAALRDRGVMPTGVRMTWALGALLRVTGFVE